MIKKFTTQRMTYTDPATGSVHRIPKITGALITKNSDNPESLYNLGTFCLQDSRYELAHKILSKSLKGRDTKETRLNLATCYKMLGNLPKAREILRGTIKDYPDFPLGYNNLGLMLYDKRDIPEAIRLYEKALELEPTYADAKWNLALALNLKYFTSIELAGNNTDKLPDVREFQKAMKFFDSRFEKTKPVTTAYHPGIKWDGQELQEGEKLWILCEQGIGDILNFLRYAYFFHPDKVILHIPAELHFLIKPPYKYTDSTEGSTDKYWIPMMSLPKYFPIINSPYIKVNNVKIPEELISCTDFKIGIVWKGNINHANDANRSRNLKDFLWLKKHGSLFSLQKDGKLGNLNWIKQLKLTDWTYTVAAVKGLDIVVCVDTSVAHLCGALGIPCIILIPKFGIDWRWGELGENCIWYESVRFARMQSMDEVDRLIKEFKENGNAWGPRKYTINTSEFSETELDILKSNKETDIVELSFL